MILPILGIHTNMPSRYEDIVARLRLLGLVPTGDPQIDKMRLKKATEKKVEEIKENRERLEVQQKNQEEKALMEERIGAQILAEQNRAYFNL